MAHRGLKSLIGRATAKKRRFTAANTIGFTPGLRPGIAPVRPPRPDRFPTRPPRPVFGPTGPIRRPPLIGRPGGLQPITGPGGRFPVRPPRPVIGPPLIGRPGGPQPGQPIRPRPPIGLPITGPKTVGGSRGGAFQSALLKRPVLQNPDRFFGETGARPPGGGAFGGAIPRLLSQVAPRGGTLARVAPTATTGGAGTRVSSFRRRPRIGGQAEGAR